MLPLDASRRDPARSARPNLAAGRTELTWSGEITGTPNGDAPNILNASFNYKAEVEIPEGGAEGMIVTQGGRFGGYGFYLLKGKPVFLYNFFDLQAYRWEGAEALSPGKHTLEFDFKYDGLGPGTLAFNNVSGIGRGGTGVLKVDGKEVAMPNDGAHDPADHAVGRELRHRRRYWHAGSRRLSGTVRVHRTIDKLTLTIDRPKLSPADIEKLQAATRYNCAAE